jgi:phage terminase large subunit-like protein
LPVPGSTLDYDFVAKEIGELSAKIFFARLAYDRWRVDVFKQSLNRMGINLVMMPFGQGFKDMSPAIDVFEQLAVDGKLRHGGHPVLKWAMANAVVEKDAAGNRKLTKAKSFGRIDPVQAAVMAVGAMKLQTEAPISIAAMIG